MLSLIALASALIVGGQPETPGQGLDMPLVWTAETRTFLESAPTLADLDGDGFDEVLLAAREEMIVLDGLGRERWRWRTKGRYYTYPAVLVRKGEAARVYAADGTGLLTCLDPQGRPVWQRTMPGGASWCAPVVAELGDNRRWAVIQGDEKGFVSALDALTGEPMWSVNVGAAVVSPAVADVDGDGHVEIAAATASGTLTLLDGDGRARWTRTISGPSPTWATSAPILFRASDGRVRIAVGANEGRVTCLDGAGTTLWAADTRGAVASALSAGDTDGDGRAEVYAVTQTGVMYRFDEDGSARACVDMQGRTIAAGALADLNYDGAVEYVVCTQSGRLMVLDDRFRLLQHRIFENRTINMTPTFGRLASAPDRLCMVVSGGESGRVFCIRTPARADTPSGGLPWPAYRHDARKSGAWLGPAGGSARTAAAAPHSSQAPSLSPECMTPRGRDLDRLVTGDTVVFDIRVPEGTPLPLLAAASCIGPDGALQASLAPVLGVTGELPLTVQLDKDGAYEFEWSVTDAQGRPVSASRRSVTLDPNANERELCARSLGTLRSAADAVAATLPLSAAVLAHEAAALEAQMRDAGRDAGLVAAAERAQAVARAVEEAARLGKGTSLIAFESGTWSSAGIDRLVPTSAGPLRIARRVTRSEHEPVSVKLFNVTDRTLHVRVVVDPTRPGVRIALMRSEPVPTSRGSMAWDPLVEIGNSGLITIPSLETREVWLDASFDRAAPGRHAVRIRAMALDGAGVLEGPTGPRDVPAPETTVDVQFEVLPFAPAASGAFRMCCWATYGPGVQEDLLRHGANVFCVPQPEPIYDRQGRLTGLNSAKLDALLAPLKGRDIVALVQGMPALKPRSGTPEYAAQLRQYLAALTKHMRALGLDTAHFALYPIDEPGGAGWDAVHALTRFARIVRAVAPGVRIYVNGGAEMPMLREMDGLVDIWCPGLAQLAESSSEMSFIRATRKELWSYDCGYRYTTAIRAPLKDTHTVAEYRTSALFAARHGAVGIGFWCYNVGPDAWTRVENDYPMVYPGAAGPVTSRRWEAVREGIEDVRILLALRRVRSTTKDPAMRARLSRLLDVSLPALVDRSHREVTIGLGPSAVFASLNETTLAAFRSEMLDCVEAIRGKP
ncbi:MAG: DUF4091 domain-containing protein [Armatimonadetes bacterium]|nr:DUF4091 domain-containing protein [Armatimonadota bacterium]